MGLDGEEAEGWVRREQRLTGEEVATVRWFRWLGCRRAVKKLLESFYRMMWCCWCPWLGLRGSVAASRRRGRAAAELELAGAVGDDARVRESEIGWVSELKRVVAVLLEHWIVGGRRRGRLMTTARGYGGAPARGKEMPWKRSD
jgi:hypothetical protein